MTLKEYILTNGITKDQFDAAVKEIREEAAAKDKNKKEYEAAREVYIQAAADYLIAMNKYIGVKGKTREEYVANIARNTKEMPKCHYYYEDYSPAKDDVDKAFDEFFRAFGLK